MKLADFDYPLDRSLIAQAPPPRRARSRLMVLDVNADTVRHRRITDLTEELRPDDLLVLNQTKVLPARVMGVKESTGGKVELLFLHPVAARENRSPRRWEVLAKGTLRPGQLVRFHDNHTVEVTEELGNGRWQVCLNGQGAMDSWLGRVGQVPLPPYIERPEEDRNALRDRRRYQTVYARVPGSVAAPTAGLHFSRGLLHRLQAGGVTVSTLTLHIGVGTFQPIRCEEVSQHRMAPEYLDIGASLCRAVARCRRRGGRVVAVGTSTVRALESAAGNRATLRPVRGWTELFIRPGHRFRMVDLLLTNFHLPKSSLLCLVSALAGRERLLAAYREAAAARYRFYSYGDAMLISPGRHSDRARRFPAVHRGVLQ